MITQQEVLMSRLLATTTTGIIQGGAQDGGIVFKGIPFAAPPIGPRRFRPPQPVEPWEGVRDTTRFGPACPQWFGGSSPIVARMQRIPASQDEDCLYLNVWTPAADHGLRGSSKNKALNRASSREERIIPLAMKGVSNDEERAHLLIGELAPRWIAVGVELALNRQPSLSGGRRDQFHDHGVIHQRLAAPVLADPREEAMLDFIPFARSRRQMAHRDRQAKFICQVLKFPFPQADPRTVAPSTIRTDEQPFCFWILLPPFLVPPPTNAFDRKGCRIVVDAHIDPARIAL